MHTIPNAIAETVVSALNVVQHRAIVQRLLPPECSSCADMHMSWKHYVAFWVVVSPNIPISTSQKGGTRLHR